MRKRLQKVIAFHYPGFDPKRNTSFPYIETLLTEIAVNLEMFEASHHIEGAFKRNELREIQAELLTEIANWFHGLYERAHNTAWLVKAIHAMRDEQATVISFNWDLILDHGLFDGQINASMYGLGRSEKPGPRLLNPHGSLNWYLGPQAKPIKDTRKIKIHSGKSSSGDLWAFLPLRGVKTSNERLYTPFHRGSCLH